MNPCALGRCHTSPLTVARAPSHQEVPIVLASLCSVLQWQLMLSLRLFVAISLFLHLRLEGLHPGHRPAISSRSQDTVQGRNDRKPAVLRTSCVSRLPPVRCENLPRIFCGSHCRGCFPLWRRRSRHSHGGYLGDFWDCGRFVAA